MVTGEGTGLGEEGNRVSPPQSLQGQLVSLCAHGIEAFGRTFFPDTFRQKSPEFHTNIVRAVENPDNRHVAVEVFRGGAKTTLLRAISAKRISYGISRTIVFVSETQEHSIRSIRWLKSQVEKNTRWTEIFGLKRGVKWTDVEIQIKNTILDTTITVIAVGITGQIRGINVDDYRPDFIIADDPCDEENTGTPEARKKIKDLFFGALEKTLAPRSESPDATMVLLQTPLAFGDLVTEARTDPLWTSLRYSCFNEEGKSTWVDRWTTEELIEQKQAHINNGNLALWLREQECTLTSAENSSFRQEALRVYDELPDGVVYFMAIDPVPPPSDIQIARGLQGKDYEAFAVVAVKGINVYLVEYRFNRGHNPDWTIKTFFELLQQYRPLRVRIEAIAYQRTLKWLLEQEMRKRVRWVEITTQTDGRKKLYKITDNLGSVVGPGHFYIREGHQEFLSQYIAFPNLEHDDIIDAVSEAVAEARSMGVIYDSIGAVDESNIPDLEYIGACP